MGRAGQIAMGAAALAVTGLTLGSTLQGLGDRTAQPWPTYGAAEELRGSGRADSGDANAGMVSPWIELRDAGRRFVLKENIFGQEPSLYSVRRHAAGGGRLDQLVFGSPAGTGPHLRLTFYLPLDEPVGDVSFWLEMARRAGEAGLALERSPPVPGVFATRFGVFEYGALKATGAYGRRDCLGFRRQVSGPRSGRSELLVSGLACLGDGAADPAFARQALVCALETITLADKEEAKLKALFDRSSAPVCASGELAASGSDS